MIRANPHGRRRLQAQDGNSTDPESHIMKSNDVLIQGHNAQVGVDAVHRLIVGQNLAANASDQGHLIPMVDAMKANTGHKPSEVSIGTSYCSEANAATRWRPRRAGHCSRYRLRKQVIEPVFRQIKRARSFRQILLRSIENVERGWDPICIVHNILKLAHAP
jgi:hypothetical protein